MRHKRAEEELREGEEHRVVLALAELGAVQADPSTGQILRLNPKMCEITGYSEEELLGMTFFEILHSDDHEEDFESFRRMVDGETSEYSVEKRWVRKDGRVAWLSVNATLIRDEVGEPLRTVVAIQDITERKRVEEAHSFLAEAGELLSSSLDYRTTLASVARLALPRLADWCAVDVLDEAGSIHRLAVAHQDSEKVAWAHELQRRYPPDHRDYQGVPQVLRSGRSELYPEITDAMLVAAARDPEHLKIMRELGFTSAMIVPLVARERILGVITLVSAESGRRYEPTDLQLVEDLAHRAAVAVDNARLYQEARKEITERERVEVELRTSRDQLEIILHGVAEGITAQDPTGRLIYANEVAAKIIGYSSAQALLKAPLQEVRQRFEVMDEHRRPLPPNQLPGRLALQGERNPEALLCFREVATGKERWSVVSAVPVFDEGGQVRFAINIFRDVTERRRTEEMRSRLAAIVESSEDAIISKTLEGIITSWNSGAQRIYGYSPEEVVGKPISILVPPDLPDEIPRILQRIRQGKAIKHYETARVTKDGKRLDVSLTISPVRDSRGNIMGASTIARDITERKRIEKEVRLLNERLEERVRQRTAELEEANKELESFSYSVSHDLRAPLRHIGGFAELLQGRLSSALDETSERYLQTILESVEHAGALVDNLLSFSRMARSQMRFVGVDTERLVREMLNDMRFETEGRNLSWKMGKLPEVRGDPSMLRLVWQNLLSNAVKYTRHREEAVIEVGARSNGDETVFFVSDNGVGFDAQYAHKLFGVFQRLHSAEEFEGTGIGLATVRRIVNRHGGRTWAEGSVGSGATFYFSLPEGRNDDETR